MQNALVGRKVPPSSPTPTTATINKLTRPTEDHPHESVKVVFKTEQDILEELNQILGFRSQTKRRDVTIKARTNAEKDSLNKIIALLLNIFAGTYPFP
ncbi:hypothetical protein ACEQPO_16885 [Bacillus sp. SL00103]